MRTLARFRGPIPVKCVDRLRGPCSLTPAQGASPGTVQVPTSPLCSERSRVVEWARCELWLFGSCQLWNQG